MSWGHTSSHHFTAGVLGAHNACSTQETRSALPGPASLSSAQQDKITNDLATLSLHEILQWWKFPHVPPYKISKSDQLKSKCLQTANVLSMSNRIEHNSVEQDVNPGSYIDGVKRCVDQSKADMPEQC